jgi:asparagine synthase (glutamine-hydrolysing)
MCGIAGLFKVNKEIDLIKNMILSLEHRGPDAQEFWYNHEKHISFGHARLSIVDLASGNQPMTDVYGRYTIVFNGEIYGYKTLKEKYNQYPYNTSSDTELIFAMLYEHGYEFVKFLPGMFAFVIYDSENDEIFGARDRFGEKPFFYTTHLGGFAFASELKALKSVFSNSLTIDLRSVSSYFERLYVPVNQCIYQEIKKLQPASSFVFKNGKLTINRYWDFPQIRENINFDDAVDLLNLKIIESVKKQLVADVKVGTFLSGGLDSSLITAISSKLLDQPVSTYSFGFTKTPGRNELNEARMHSERIGTNHTEFDESEFNMFNIFQNIQNYFDEPFADSSAIPMYIISNYASKYGKVILTGDGGDELFGGYSQWYDNIFNTEAKQESKNKIIGLNGVKRKIKEIINKRNSNLAKMDRISKKQNQFLYRHEKNNIFFDFNKIIELGLPFPYGYKYDFKSDNSLNDVLLTDIQNYMVADILVKTDTTSMANSLELRAPFLDVNLAEYAITLPTEFKYQGKENKIILRELIKKHYPYLELQKDKLGFGAPVEDWLKLKEFKEYKNYLINDRSAPIFNYLNYKYLRGSLDMNNYRTWTVLNFNCWLENQK